MDRMNLLIYLAAKICKYCKWYIDVFTIFFSQIKELQFFSKLIAGLSIHKLLIHTKTSLLRKLQAQTLPDEAPQIGKINPSVKWT